MHHPLKWQQWCHEDERGGKDGETFWFGARNNTKN